jgi:hypothetical protein
VKVSSVKLSTESAGLKNADPKGNFATIWGPECTDIIADKQGQLHRCGSLVLSLQGGVQGLELECCRWKRNLAGEAIIGTNVMMYESAAYLL